MSSSRVGKHKRSLNEILLSGGSQALKMSGARGCKILSAYGGGKSSGVVAKNRQYIDSGISNNNSINQSPSKLNQIKA